MFIEFAKSQGDYDVLSPMINVIGNGTVLAVGGIILAKIAAVVAKRFGCSEKTAKFATAIPVVIGVVAAVAVLGAAAFVMNILMNYRRT